MALKKYYKNPKLTRSDKKFSNRIKQLLEAILRGGPRA
jgi:hypothetical protein